MDYLFHLCGFVVGRRASGRPLAAATLQARAEKRSKETKSTLQPYSGFEEPGIL